jgi:hypothetical protein
MQTLLGVAVKDNHQSVTDFSKPYLRLLLPSLSGRIEDFSPQCRDLAARAL